LRQWLETGALIIAFRNDIRAALFRMGATPHEHEKPTPATSKSAQAFSVMRTANFLKSSDLSFAIFE